MPVSSSSFQIFCNVRIISEIWTRGNGNIHSIILVSSRAIMADSTNNFTAGRISCIKGYKLDGAIVLAADRTCLRKFFSMCWQYSMSTVSSSLN